MRKLAAVLVVSGFVLVFGACPQGAVAEDIQDYWFTGEGVNQPSLEGSILPAEGPTADPIIEYDAVTGLMRVLSQGNWLVAIIVDGPALPTTFLLVTPTPPGFELNNRGGGSKWISTEFAGKLQAYDDFGGGKDGDFDLAMYVPGLGPDAFGVVEWGATPVVGEPGTSGFTTVTIVPEPATMALLGLGGMAMLTRKRRRR